MIVDREYLDSCRSRHCSILELDATHSVVTRFQFLAAGTRSRLAPPAPLPCLRPRGSRSSVRHEFLGRAHACRPNPSGPADPWTAQRRLFRRRHLELLYEVPKNRTRSRLLSSTLTHAETHSSVPRR